MHALVIILIALTVLMFWFGWKILQLGWMALLWMADHPVNALALAGSLLLLAVAWQVWRGRGVRVGLGGNGTKPPAEGPRMRPPSSPMARTSLPAAAVRRVPPPPGFYTIYPRWNEWAKAPFCAARRPVPVPSGPTGPVLITVPILLEELG